MLLSWPLKTVLLFVTLEGSERDALPLKTFLDGETCKQPLESQEILHEAKQVSHLNQYMLDITDWVSATPHLLYPNTRRHLCLQAGQADSRPSVLRALRLNSPEWPFLAFGVLAAIVTGCIRPIFSVIYADSIGVSVDSVYTDAALKLPL